MSPELLKDVATLLTALVAIFKYFQYKTRRDRVAAVGTAFDSVVKSLSSGVEVERLAAAIRLRRFFDPESELGVGRILKPEVDEDSGTERIPYASEALNVLAAVLRTQKPGTLQKALADGLAFAPSLVRADLQRTNLQNAYLRRRSAGAGAKGTEVDLSYADFYRADLSGASLKGARARGAVFYQARLLNTVLAGADLREANFFEADVAGAQFRGAILAGANFKGARNVPLELAKRLTANELYPDDRAPFNATEEMRRHAPVQIFLSRPGGLDSLSRRHVELLGEMLEEQDMLGVELDRSEYPESGALTEVRRRMSGCAGVVVFGFSHLKVTDGSWQSDAAGEVPVKGLQLPTPWIQIEAGMAAMRGLPILLVCQPGVVGGIFDADISDYLVHRVGLNDDRNSPSFQATFSAWCAAVREQAQKVEVVFRS